MNDLSLPSPSPSPSPLSLFLPLLSLFCFLQPAWFLMVGGDRSFKLALKEEDEEVVSTHYINSVCWNEREGRGGERMRGVDGKGGKRGRGDLSH